MCDVRMNFNKLRHCNVEKWRKMHFYVSANKLEMTKVKIFLNIIFHSNRDHLCESFICFTNGFETVALVYMYI